MTSKEKRILFVCKKRNDTYGISYGLINSCLFICNALKKQDIECKVVQVVDNNCIDKVVFDYNPTHVFIEALWVTPDKFHVLLPRYPTVQWYVRIHSKIPFIANEGVAIEWLRGYDGLQKIYSNISISANNTEFIDAFNKAYGIDVLYHPNIYCPTEYEADIKPVTSDPKFIDVGCFGAVRPMKNHLIQALAAISFGNQIGKNIRFHINSNRIEQKGDSILKNLINAFKNTNKHQLVEHPWMSHSDFITLVKKMEIGLQVSYSETFNIVAADFAWNGIPVIGSSEIDWVASIYKADPNSVENIISKLYIAYYGRQIGLQKLNLSNLKKYNKNSLKVWLNFLGI